MGNTNTLPLHQIRADYDRSTIVVYQAYRAEIAEPAVRAQRFVEPFSLNRMTWVKLLPKERPYELPPHIARRLYRAGAEDQLSDRLTRLPR